MKRIIFLTLVLLVSNLFAQQDQSVFEKVFSNVQYTGIDALPIFENGIESNVFTSEYLWWNNSGSLSGFGFFDIGYKRPYFTNHSLNFVPFSNASFLMLSTEIGGSSNGFFNQIGPKVNVNKTPFVKSVSQVFTKALFVSHYIETHGKPNPYETLFVWETTHIPMFGFELYSTGFWRVRGGERSDYAQPQFWLRHNKLPIALGTELEVIGSNAYPLLGAKLFVFER